MNDGRKSNQKRRDSKSTGNIARTATIFLIILLASASIGILLSLPPYTKSSKDIESAESKTEETLTDVGAGDNGQQYQDEGNTYIKPTQAAIAEEEKIDFDRAKKQQNVLELQNDLLDDQVLEKIQNMTIEEKIYQLFVVTPEMLTGTSKVVTADDSTRNSLHEMPVGGLVYLASNFTSPDQAKDMISNTQEYAHEIEGMPLFLCVDEEGGRVTRIAQNSSFGLEKIEAMGTITNAEEAYRCGDTIGEYLNDLGINVDFAPDADVLTNSSNIVIGDRSFGSNPVEVSEFAKAFSDGLHNHGILSTYKHFPGHGATEADTHKGYAYTDKTYDELLQSELIPFTHADEYGIDMVMVAHISLPNVIGDDTPCSLSEMIITDILREEMSYDGIVITDALNMGAITEKYSAAEATVKAFEAGADLLLAPGSVQDAYNGLYDAYMNGEISEERIDESLKRIIRAKVMLDSEKSVFG